MELPPRLRIQPKTRRTSGSLLLCAEIVVETQAQYDEDVIANLRTVLPGVDVQFEHSGWSSNWGRLLDRYVLLGNGADAVVLMYMMRTMLERRLREGLTRPWIPCTSAGRGGILASIIRAAVVGLEQRLKRSESPRVCQVSTKMFEEGGGRAGRS